jgi:hypothetical protein
MPSEFDATSRSALRDRYAIGGVDRRREQSRRSCVPGLTVVTTSPI